MRAPRCGFRSCSPASSPRSSATRWSSSAFGIRPRAGSSPTLMAGSETGGSSASRPGSATSPRSSSSARWSPLRSGATPHRSSSATMLPAGGTTSSRRSSSSRCVGINFVGSRVVDRAQSLIVFLLLIVFAIFIASRSSTSTASLLSSGRLPVVLDHPRKRGTHVLRVPRIQRHHVRRRRPSRSSPRVATGDVHRAGRHGHHVHPHLARRVRHAHRRRGGRVRRDRDRRGSSPGAR